MAVGSREGETKSGRRARIEGIKEGSSEMGERGRVTEKRREGEVMIGREIVRKTEIYRTLQRTTPSDLLCGHMSIALKNTRLCKPMIRQH